MKPQTILHPTDGSASAGRALEVAVRLAAMHRAALLILHAELLHGEGPREASAALDKCVATARGLLRSLAGNDAPEVHGVRTRALFAHDAVLEVATDRHVDLIVMGTHGRSGLSRLLPGKQRRTSAAPRPLPLADRPSRLCGPDRRGVPGASRPGRLLRLLQTRARRRRGVGGIRRRHHSRRPRCRTGALDVLRWQRQEPLRTGRRPADPCRRTPSHLGWRPAGRSVRGDRRSTGRRDLSPGRRQEGRSDRHEHQGSHGRRVVAGR